MCRVAEAVAALKGFHASHIPVASVATGFPSGQVRPLTFFLKQPAYSEFLLHLFYQYPLKTRLAEIRAAVEDGAREIDIVINRTMALNRQWKELYEEARDPA